MVKTIPDYQVVSGFGCLCMAEKILIWSHSFEILYGRESLNWYFPCRDPGTSLNNTEVVHRYWLMLEMRLLN